MEHTVVKIGGNHNRRGASTSSSSTATPRRMGNTVDIYFGQGEKAHLFAQGVPEGLLRRFTRSGRDQLAPFRKTEDKEVQVQALIGTEASCQTARDINELGQDITSLKLDNSTTSVNAYTGGQVKTMHLAFDVQVYPSTKAFNIIFAWMIKNRPIQMPRPVLPLIPPNLAEVNLFTLVDTYAATIALDLMPRAKELRDVLLARITNVPLTATDMKLLWTRIPHNVHGDGIFMRMVRAYYGHDKAGHLTEKQKDDIWSYTLSEPALDQKFLDVEEEQKKRAAEAARTKTDERHTSFEQRQLRLNPELQWQSLWKQGGGDIEAGDGLIGGSATVSGADDGVSGTPKL